MTVRRQHGERETDALVVGGGPAGSTVALALARAGVAVLVAERSGYNAPHIGEHLTPACRPILERLGLWRNFVAARHLSSPGIRAAWGSETLVERDYLFNAYGDGWNLERAAFDRMLADAAAAAGAEFHRNARVSALRRAADGWRARIEHESGEGLSVRARLIVDASGRAAAIARLLGGRRVAHDRLIGLAAWLPLRAKNNGCARLVLEAVDDGWWYATPLPNGRLVAVRMTDGDLAPTAAAAAPRHWLESLGHTHHIRAMVDGRGPHQVLEIRAAHSSIMEPMTGEGWLAVGDAATAYDPLSSMGILKALDDGVAAAAAIMQYLSGDHDALAVYDETVTRSFARYLAERGAVYRREQRWPQHIFWRRRHADLAARLSR